MNSKKNIRGQMLIHKKVYVSKKYMQTKHLVTPNSKTANRKKQSI